MRAALAVALLATSGLLLAGCLGGDGTEAVTGPVQDPDWAVRAIFAGADPRDTDNYPDHDHANRSLHTGLSSSNVEVLGQTELASPYFGTPAGTAFCGDVGNLTEGRQIAVVHSFQTDVALTVLDVTDRSAPVVLGELVLPFVFTYDAAVFEDGRYAILAGNPDLGLDVMPVAGGPGVPFKAMWRDACGEREVGSNVDYVPYGYSAILVDLADPVNPVVASFYEYAGGRNIHSVSTAIVDGTRYVALSGLGAIPCTVPGVPGAPPPPVAVPCQPVPRYGNLLSHFDFLTVEETPAGAELAPFALYTPTDQSHLDPSLLYLANGHTDATIQKHPATGQVIAYLADWDGGLHIVRLDGPQQVVPLSSWGAAPGDDPTQMQGNIHSARPLSGLRDGHHYTLTGQEVIGRPAGRPTGQIVLLDTTNPAAPEPVARWTLPVDVDWPGALGLAFSTHYPVLVNDTLYVAMYHAGVWAADARPEVWPELPSLGVFIPDGVPSTPPHLGSLTPEVLEILDLGDGTLLTFDADGMAYVIRLDRDDPDVPPAAPWTKDAWIS